MRRGSVFGRATVAAPQPGAARSRFRTEVSSSIGDVILPPPGTVAMRHIPIIVDRTNSIEKRWIGVTETMTFDDLRKMVLDHVRLAMHHVDNCLPGW